MKWKISCATMTGKMHLENKENCQDLVWQSLSDRFSCITMADGAGTASFAEKGACLAVETVKSFLEQKGPDIFTMEVEDLKKAILLLLRQQFTEACQENRCGMIDLSTTLLFFATDGEHYVAANIGDGLVGRIAQDGEEEVILQQDLGHFVNETYFITDADSERHFHITIGDFDSGSTYFLLTDGSCDCLCNSRPPLFAPLMHKFVRWLKEYPFEEVNTALGTMMYKLFPNRTDDDCAIAMLKMEEDGSSETT